MTEYKMNKDTLDALFAILAFLNDGRVFLARERLEEILGLNTTDVA